MLAWKKQTINIDDDDDDDFIGQGVLEHLILNEATYTFCVVHKP